MRPVDVTPERVLEVYNNLYHGLKPTNNKTKFKVGDYVRISREKQTFEKGLEDLDKDAIQGTFYEAELQKVTKPETFKIAYIVRSKGKKGSRQHFVHWRGYPEKSRSWILDSDLV
ncbi:uncharacterized protein LOC127749399 [Frankliniella occidentalis]|uniref:Uncharacterized protein LOC127749399 n=1 Tax=Frankliniella occidentalis TaxID=133901 RepID=A0A9C6U8H3_FRAOC|nr:uncharacterized protein LOC127749399 [Frankliniella occidentalis]